MDLNHPLRGYMDVATPLSVGLCTQRLVSCFPTKLKVPQQKHSHLFHVEQFKYVIRLSSLLFFPHSETSHSISYLTSILNFLFLCLSSGKSMEI